MKKPFKIAAYSCIIFLILGFVLGIIYGVNFSIIPVISLTSMSWVFHIVLFILSVLVIYGFIVLGKKFKNKFLIIIGYIGIVLNLLYLIYLLFGSFFLEIPIGQNIDSFAILFYLIYSIIFGVHTIFFGISLLKLKNKIKYSKSAGILNIVGGATLFIYLGSFVIIAATIMEILLLFEASRRFERK